MMQLAAGEENRRPCRSRHNNICLSGCLLTIVPLPTCTAPHTAPITIKIGGAWFRLLWGGVCILFFLRFISTRSRVNSPIETLRGARATLARYNAQSKGRVTNRTTFPAWDDWTAVVADAAPKRVAKVIWTKIRKFYNWYEFQGFYKKKKKKVSMFFNSTSFLFCYSFFFIITLIC